MEEYKQPFICNRLPKKAIKINEVSCVKLSHNNFRLWFKLNIFVTFTNIGHLPIILVQYTNERF